MDIFDASQRYIEEGRALIILAGKEYGSGSSRDWAAKGPWMLVSLPPIFHISCGVYPVLFYFTRGTVLTLFTSLLQGIKAVIAESFERIHRSNLVGMGIIPMQYLPGQNADSLGLTGKESYTIKLPADVKSGQNINIEVSVFSCISPRFFQ